MGMSIRRTFLFGLCACVLLPALAVAQTRPATGPTLTINVRADRADAVYRVGDPVQFNVRLTGANREAAADQRLEYTVSNDGTGKVVTGELKAGREPATVKVPATQPGILRIEVTGDADGKKTTAVAGAAVDPEKLRPSMDAPSGFDSFWQKQLSRLAAEPAHATTTPVNSPDPTVEAVDLQITCPGGMPVSAYYAKPKGAKPKSLPAILYPHSAGVRSSDLPHAVHGARMGAICIDVNAHGIPNGRPASFYADLQNGDLKGYAGRNPEDPEGFYFNGMFLRLMRAMEFLTTQPEWDGKTLVVAGSSQGGGQAIVAAGLDPRVTLICASVPALCDHTGFVNGGPTGWPHHLGTGSSAKAVEVARYYDAVNFARRARCESLLTVGLVDRTCPPTTVFSAYNVLPETKRIIIEPAMGHEFPSRLATAFDDRIREHIETRKGK
jgi:cephalosporin-C deacetylase-like acetyl esterase